MNRFFSWTQSLISNKSEKLKEDFLGSVELLIATDKEVIIIKLLLSILNDFKQNLPNYFTKNFKTDIDNFKDFVSISKTILPSYQILIWSPIFVDMAKEIEEYQYILHIYS